jgi:diguanylate cyclase (GGDEF)-like protein/PAS domain S-box-containing protein
MARSHTQLVPANEDNIFREITELAAQLCGAAFAAITLHERLRHKPLAVFGGLEISEMPRDSRFCCEVLHSGAPLEVSDAAFDVRYHDDPLVASGPRIRFYSGVPLIAKDGKTIGTLSVFDPRPKVMQESQRAALWQLADVVMQLLASRRNERRALWFGTVLENSLNEIAIFDATTNRVVHANRGALANLGYTLDEIKRFTAADFVVGWDERARREAQEPLLTGERDSVTLEIALKRKDGSTYPAEARVQLVQGEDGPVFVTTAYDITTRKTAEEHLSWQASHDTLTQLANRREFEIVAARHLESARRHGVRHAVLFIDLDQFKVVNDTCGHLAGDALLRNLSQVLAAKTRRSDTLARLGGDEFGVLLEGCDLLHAQRLAAQLLAAIRAFRFPWEGRVFALGASIGVAEITPDSRDLESVLSAADTACYLAKDKGRNQVQVYRPDDEEISTRAGQMSWVSRITTCVEENRFFLHCQRVVSLDAPPDTTSNEYLELLLRMRDEQGRMVTPMAFIPAAERYHLMGTIDRWVVSRALRCLSRLKPAAKSLVMPRFGVNISGMSLGDPAFEEFLLQHLEEAAIPANSLLFEITETAAIANLTRAARFIRGFRDLGCRFALDDFGSGLSSFTYLKALPVDYLKIDGSFVRDITEDPIDLAVVDSIHRLGRATGAKTIAECVESPAILQRVRDLGVDCGQGHFLHRPEPYSQLAARMDYPAPGNCVVHAA